MLGLSYGKPPTSGKWSALKYIHAHQCPLVLGGQSTGPTISEQGKGQGWEGMPGLTASGSRAGRKGRASRLKADMAPPCAESESPRGAGPEPSGFQERGPTVQPAPCDSQDSHMYHPPFLTQARLQASSKRHKGKNCGLGLSSPLPPFLGEDSPAILGVLGGEWWWWRPSGELAASPPPPLPVRRAQGKALRGKGDLTRRKGIRGIRSKLAGDSLCPQDSSQKYLLRTYYTIC